MGEVQRWAEVWIEIWKLSRQFLKRLLDGPWPQSFGSDAHHRGWHLIFLSPIVGMDWPQLSRFLWCKVQDLSMEQPLWGPWWLHRRQKTGGSQWITCLTRLETRGFSKLYLVVRLLSCTWCFRFLCWNSCDKLNKIWLDMLTWLSARTALTQEARLVAASLAVRAIHSDTLKYLLAISAIHGNPTSEWNKPSAFFSGDHSHAGVLQVLLANAEYWTCGGYMMGTWYFSSIALCWKVRPPAEFRISWDSSTSTRLQPRGWCPTPSPLSLCTCEQFQPEVLDLDLIAN